MRAVIVRGPIFLYLTHFWNQVIWWITWSRQQPMNHQLQILIWALIHLVRNCLITIHSWKWLFLKSTSGTSGTWHGKCVAMYLITLIIRWSIPRMMTFGVLKFARNDSLIFADYRQNLLIAAEKVRVTAYTIHKNKLIALIIGCIAYTRQYESSESCPSCQSPQWDSSDQCSQFRYISLEHQIQLMYMKRSTAKKLQMYQAELQRC